MENVADAEHAIAERRLGERVGGRWTLERLLGIGGMAAVFAARNAAGESAAIKLLHPEMSLRADVCQRFLREGYVANRVNHPGAVRILDHGMTVAPGGQESAYLAMELLSGETLGALMRRTGPLPVAQLLDFLDQILDVLSAAHESGIVHRDLKPDNLFVTEGGSIKILDFGLARVLDGAFDDFRTRTGVALGTLPYMAPEQALGKRDAIDGRVDLFAVGATAFRVLSGKRVHEADSEAELLMAMASRPAPPLDSAAPGVSPEVCAVVDLALAFDRHARYPDAQTMQRDVRAVRAGTAPPYAETRTRARKDVTRAEHAVTAPPVSGPGYTQPMPAIANVTRPSAAKSGRPFAILLALAAFLTMAGAAIAAVFVLRAMTPQDRAPASTSEASSVAQDSASAIVGPEGQAKSALRDELPSTTERAASAPAAGGSSASKLPGGEVNAHGSSESSSKPDSKPDAMADQKAALRGTETVAPETTPGAGAATLPESSAVKPAPAPPEEPEAEQRDAPRLNAPGASQREPSKKGDRPQRGRRARDD